MLTFVNTQSGDILTVEITVAVAAIEMLQYRVLQIHIEQIVRLRKTVLVPTILAVTANWTLVVRVG